MRQRGYEHGYITHALPPSTALFHSRGKNMSLSSCRTGVHESQSLLWERCVALQKPFQHYLLAKLRDFFPDDFPESVTAEQLYGAMNKVCLERNTYPPRPNFLYHRKVNFEGLIRVESDELTYTMHVILRYEIEKGLINGEIAVEDVPKVWNAKMQEYLGVTPGSDASGCLQDVHWSGGGKQPCVYITNTDGY